VAGFRRYGLVDPAVTVVAALFDASRWFEHGRVPELFCGFSRGPDHGPIAYPVAWAPQAWAAAAPLQWLAALAGFEADAVPGRLTLHASVELIGRRGELEVIVRR
jgi:glycogen debranching enzyme